MIKDKVIGLERIPWREIESLQPENIKHVYNYQHIEDSINKNGFSFPFAVWKDESTGIIYAIDGHTRKEVLSSMAGVPDLLPAFFIDAKDREEAIKILLDVFNQKQNPIDQEVLAQWLEVEEIEVEGVAVESLNVKQGFSDTGEDIDFDNIKSNEDREPADNTKNVTCQNCGTKISV